MERRFEIQKRKIFKEADITPQVFNGMLKRLEQFVKPFIASLGRREPKDKARRKKCGVPKQIRYQTRHEQALDMLKNNGKYLPHSWIAGDDEMGRSSRFRRDLRALGEQYLLAVPSNTGIRDLDSLPPAYGGRGQPPKQPFGRVDIWRGSLGDDAWSRINVRDGEKGPLVIEIVKRRVVARTKRSCHDFTEELLVVTRTPDGNGKVKYESTLKTRN